MDIIKYLSTIIDKNKDLINNFFEQYYKKYDKIFYNSVDIRNSGFKLAPVDTNCFPAGFNNINENSFLRAKNQAAHYIFNFIKNNKSFLNKINNNKIKINIAIIAENHTRNTNYLANLLNIKEILTFQNFSSKNIDSNTDYDDILLDSEVRIIWPQSKIDSNELDCLKFDEFFLTINFLNPLSINGKIFDNIKFDLLQLDSNIATKNGLICDIAILNNDLTNLTINLLNKDIQTAIVPSPQLGWFQRSKFDHFTIYNILAQEISDILNFDQWLISSFIDIEDNIDFKNKIGLDLLANKVDNLLSRIEEKYKIYNIKQKPYCYVKSDNGTYGMAVTEVYSGDEVLNFNKKNRNKMNAIKGSVVNNRVIIQEGIATIDLIDNKPAEPLIYLLNSEVIANLFRFNVNEDSFSNLNNAGATFIDSDNILENQYNLFSSKNDVDNINKFIAKLASLASAIEAAKLQDNLLN